MISPVLVFSLLLVGCSVPTKTQRALVCDVSGHPLPFARMRLEGEQPKVSIQPTMCVLYTNTVTDRSGFCVATYPAKKGWPVFATYKQQDFGLQDFKQENGYLRITVFPLHP